MPFLKLQRRFFIKIRNESFDTLLSYCRGLGEEGLEKLLDTASIHRENRRNKSPRAIENAIFTFEIVADFGSYRDLQRHRILTQDRQLLSCSHGYFMPKELIESGLDQEYKKALSVAKKRMTLLPNNCLKKLNILFPWLIIYAGMSR